MLLIVPPSRWIVGLVPKPNTAPLILEGLFVADNVNVPLPTTATSSCTVDPSNAKLELSLHAHPVEYGNSRQFGFAVAECVQATGNRKSTRGRNFE